jgi:hypothetical protein
VDRLPSAFSMFAERFGVVWSAIGVLPTASAANLVPGRHR